VSKQARGMMIVVVVGEEEMRPIGQSAKVLGRRAIRRAFFWAADCCRPQERVCCLFCIAPLLHWSIGALLRPIGLQCAELVCGGPVCSVLCALCAVPAVKRRAQRLNFVLALACQQRAQVCPGALSGATVHERRLVVS